MILFHNEFCSNFSFQESVNRLAKPKHHVSHESIHNKYVSVAEAVRNFHRITPARFHGKHKTDILQKNEVRREVTIPKSPHFTTIRHRPVDALSREEKEWQEFQEQQKYVQVSKRFRLV